VVDRAGDEGDTEAAGLPGARRDLAELSEAARDLDRRIEQHLARLRRERPEHGDPPGAHGGIPGQRLPPGS
jgi:hypothetical protein